MKSVVMLWIACLSEAGDQCQVRTHRDEAYALSRIEDEGLAFLAITLPAFEKDLLTAVSRGYIGSDLFCGFRKRGGLPAFLSGFLLRVFDTSGSIRADPSPQHLRALRQILLLMSKIELPTSQVREEAAIAAYIDTDRGLEDVSLSLDLIERFEEKVRAVLLPYLSAVESLLYSGEWLPRHSSGALATRESYNSRFSFRTWTERLQKVLPWWEDSGIGVTESLDHDVLILAPDEEPPVRVALVPKTMKGPRIIAMEPVWNQFVQQGILHAMTEVLERPTFRPLADRFSWKSQEPNRELARVGSLDGSFATLDLSEASDRVSLELAELLFSRTPFLRECVLASRSLRASTPGGETITLNKFASMGSSLCFPVESMVFFIISLLAIDESMEHGTDANRPVGLPTVRVYGDDLIVPEAAALSLKALLESYGLKVNARKSFTTGLFRESCGSDWFMGCDVSVFRLKSPLPSSRHQLELMDKGIQFHNRVYDAGWYGLGKAVEDHLKKVYPPLPYVPIGTPTSALWSWDKVSARRLSTTLHRHEVKTVVFRQTKPIDPAEGYGALRKFFQPHGDEPRDKEHLERDGRTRYAGMNIGWTRLG